MLIGGFASKEKSRDSELAFASIFPSDRTIVADWSFSKETYQNLEFVPLAEFGSCIATEYCAEIKKFSQNEHIRYLFVISPKAPADGPDAILPRIRRVGDLIETTNPLQLDYRERVRLFKFDLKDEKVVWSASIVSDYHPDTNFSALIQQAASEFSKIVR